MLLVCEAVAVVLALAGPLDDTLARRRLLSIYLQWIGVCSAAALCLIRRYAGDRAPREVALAAWLTLLAVTFAIGEITYVAGRHTGFGLLFARLSWKTPSATASRACRRAVQSRWRPPGAATGSGCGWATRWLGAAPARPGIAQRWPLSADA